MRRLKAAHKSFLLKEVEYMDYFLLETEDVLKETNSTPDGLTTAEAERRLAENGKNKLDEPPKKSFAKKLFDSILDPMVLMLVVAAVISLVVAIANNESFTDVFIILFVVALNAFLSVIQENKAEQAMDAMKNLNKPFAKVYRDGVQREIKSEDLDLESKPVHQPH